MVTEKMRLVFLVSLTEATCLRHIEKLQKIHHVNLESKLVKLFMDAGKVSTLPFMWWKWS